MDEEFRLNLFVDEELSYETSSVLIPVPLAFACLELPGNADGARVV